MKSFKEILNEVKMTKWERSKIKRQAMKNSDASKWAPGDGAPDGTSPISQPKYWDLPNSDLEDKVRKAKKYIKDKTNRDYKHLKNRNREDIKQQQNNIYDAGEVLRWRKENGKIVVN